MASDEDRRVPMLATIATFFIITLTVVVARIWTTLHRQKHLRQKLLRQKHLIAADYIIIIAMVANTISVTLKFVAVGYGFGKHTSAIPDGDIGTISNYLLGSSMAGVITLGLARISTASLFIHIMGRHQRTGWKFAIFCLIIALQILLVAAYGIVQLVQLVRCKEMLTSRSDMYEEQCLGRIQVVDCILLSVFSYMFVTVCTLGDCSCILILIIIFLSLNIPVGRRVRLILLSLMGLLPIACGVTKFCFAVLYKWDTDDPIWDLFFETLFRGVEEALIIITACTLSLKRPVRDAMGRLKSRSSPPDTLIESRYSNPPSTSSGEQGFDLGKPDNGPAQSEVYERVLRDSESGSPASWMETP